MLNDVRNLTSILILFVLSNVSTDILWYGNNMVELIIKNSLNKVKIPREKNAKISTHELYFSKIFLIRLCNIIIVFSVT